MEAEDCMDIFETVLTDDGICCTFNSVYREFMINNVRQSDVLDTTKYNDKYTGVDWTPENGFPANVKVFFFLINGLVKMRLYVFLVFWKRSTSCSETGNWSWLSYGVVCCLGCKCTRILLFLN